jgi:HAD superfamily hydrolase (TIGR01549 family)
MVYKIKVVLFDLGDVFFEAHFWRFWLYSELTKKKKFVGDFSQFYFLYDSFLNDAYTKDKEYFSCFLSFLKYLNFKPTQNFIKKAFAVKFSFEKDRHLFKDVKKTLFIINSKNIKNVIVTDNELNDFEIRSKLLKKHKINKLIFKIFTSNELNTTKSNPIYFIKVLQKLKLKPSEVIFVGHDIDEIESAKKAKILTIEYNNYLQLCVSADYKINDFIDLLKLIEEFK